MTLELASSDMGRWVAVLAPAAQLAERIAGTEFVPKPMRNRPDVITAAIMYGDELGVGPMQALASIHVVEGRPQPSAELCRALILRAGHSLAVHEMTGHRCRVSGLRGDRPEAERVVVEWTWDMAKAAGLTGKTNWRSYPRAMLLARATSDLARLLFPDVIKGLSYIAEDAESAVALESWGPDTDEPEPAPKPVPRRKTPAYKRLPNPGYSIATEDKPGPDGSVDVPLAEAPTTPDPGEPVTPNTPPGPVLPETTPAEPPAEPDAGPRRIAGAPLKALQAGMAEALGRGSREDRLAALGAIVGRPVPTTSDLTRDEGYRALGFLERVRAGEAGLVQRAGVWQAVIYEPEPAPDPWDDGTPPLPMDVTP